MKAIGRVSTCCWLVAAFAVLAPYAGAMVQEGQLQQMQPQLQQEHGRSPNREPAYGVSRSHKASLQEPPVPSHTRALAQSPEPWKNPDWVNQQVENITNMIISVRNGGHTNSGSPNSSSGAGSTNAGTTVPSVASPIPTNSPLNITSIMPGGSSNSSHIAAGQLSGNVSSILDNVSVLNIPVVPSGGTATAVPATAGAGNSTASDSTPAGNSSSGAGSSNNNSSTTPPISATPALVPTNITASNLLPNSTSPAAATAASPSAAVVPINITAYDPSNNSSTATTSSSGAGTPVPAEAAATMSINITAGTTPAISAAPTANTTAAGSPAAAAAAAPSPDVAIQLVSLLSDLQPSSNTTTPFPKVNYGYNVFNTSGNMPLAVPVNNIPDLPVTRWVMTAWSISNYSSPAVLEAGDAADRRQMLLGNFTQLQPQQVQVAVTANVTVAFLFTGVQWKRPASKALQQAASEAAGGYTQAFVQVEAVEPEYGSTVAEFLDQDLQYTGDGLSDKAVTLSFLPPPDSSSTTNSNPRHRRSRKLLQQQQQQQQLPLASISEPLLTRVWVQYQRVDASNVTALMAALAAACSTDKLAAAAANRGKQQQQQQVLWQQQQVLNLTGSPFGLYSKKLLKARGAQMDNTTYGIFLSKAPTVTTNIRLAVGVTDAQTSASPSNSTDQLVALWLGNATNIVGPTGHSAAPVGEGARVSWLLTPEIWTQPQFQVANSTLPSPQPGPSGLPAGSIAGIAIGAAVGAALLAGLMVFIADRRRKHQQEQGGARRRRRRHAKPRYLLPDLPRSHEPQPPPPDTHDPDLSPEQLRAELRELGDSVTSAARFELQEQESEHAELAAAAGEPTAAAAAGSSPAAIAAGGGSSGQRVLDARAVLVLEHQKRAAQDGSADTAGTSAAAATAAAASNLDLSDSSEAGDPSSEQRLITHRGGWAPGSAAAAAAATRGALSLGNSSSKTYSQGPGSVDLAAVAAAPPNLSPTTASLSLMGAAPVLAHSSAAAAAAAMPSYGPWALPQSRVLNSRSGLQTPFANYAFDASIQQGVMPTAAAAAISAAYIKSKAPSSSSSSSGCCRQPGTDHCCTAESLAAEVPVPDSPRLAAATAASIPIPHTPQPITAPVRQASPVSMFSPSPQRNASLPHAPTTPAAAAAAARNASVSSISTTSAVSLHSGLHGSSGSSAVGIVLKQPGVRTSPFACSYNFREIAESAPSMESVDGDIMHPALAAAAAAAVAAAADTSRQDACTYPPLSQPAAPVAAQQYPSALSPHSSDRSSEQACFGSSSSSSTCSAGIRPAPGSRRQAAVQPAAEHAPCKTIASGV